VLRLIVICVCLSDYILNPSTTIRVPAQQQDESRSCNNVLTYEHPAIVLLLLNGSDKLFLMDCKLKFDIYIFNM